MEGIKSWAFSFCCASVAGALLSLLVPDSSLGKICRFSIRIFLLCCLILPVASFRQIALELPEFQIDAQSSAQQLDQTLAQKILLDTADGLQQRFGEMLTKQGLSYQKIEPIVNMGEDDSISISCIRIWPPSDLGEDILQSHYLQVLEQLERETGIAIELAVQDGGKGP
mgnify:CR=1 FL=1